MHLEPTKASCEIGMSVAQIDRFSMINKKGGAGIFRRIPISFFPFLFSILIINASQAALPQIQYLPGWPVPTNGSATSTISVADLDGNGEKDIIFGDYSYIGQNDWWLYVKAPNGSDKPGWPINLAGCASSPVIADLDDDGTLEIIKPCGGLKVWNSNGTLRWQFPNPTGIVLANATVADLDNDGLLDIVVTCTSGGAIYVFDAQGNVMPGWPVVIPAQPGYDPPGTLVSASIGDIDNDGLKEIVIGINDGTGSGYPSHVFCFKPDGSTCPGFPVGVSRKGFDSKVILADVDNDGYLEIIIGKETSELNIYRDDGTLFPGYPIAQKARGIAAGDINRDGRLDMVFCPFAGNNWMEAFDINSAILLQNFPISNPTGDGYLFSCEAPNLADLSDSNGLDIVTGAGKGGTVLDGKLYALNISGQVVNGFPSPSLYHRALATGCSVADVDGNGTTDICCGSENDESTVPKHATVYCWDTGYPYNLDNVDWAMDGFDIAHTGRWRRLYHINKASSLLSFAGCQQNP